MKHLPFLVSSIFGRNDSTISMLRCTFTFSNGMSRKARDQSQQLSPARSPVTLILTLQVICESFLSVAFIVSVEVEQMLKRKWNLFIDTRQYRWALPTEHH